MRFVRGILAVLATSVLFSDRLAIAHDAAENEEPLVEFELLPVSKRLKAVELIHPATGDPASLSKIQFSPDGKQIIAGGHPRGIVRMWDVQSGKALVTLEAGTGMRGSAPFFHVSPDWKTIYVEHRGQRMVEPVVRDGKTIRRWTFEGFIRAWDLESGKVAQTYEHKPQREVQTVRLSPDGKFLVTSERLPGEWESWPSHASGVWNVATKEYRTFDDNISPTGPFFPDGKSLIAVHREGRFTTSLLRLDLETLRVVHSIPIAERFADAHVWAISPDQHALAGQIRTFADPSGHSGFRTPFTLWDYESGRVLFSVASELKNSWFSPAEFSPDGKTIAMTQYWQIGAGDFGANLFLVDVASGAVRHEVALHEGDKRALPDVPVFSPEGKLVAVASRICPDALRYNLPNLKATDLPQPRIELIETASGRIVESIVSPQCIPEPMAFSPDGKTLASSGPGRVLLWDVSDLAGK